MAPAKAHRACNRLRLRRPFRDKSLSQGRGSCGKTILLRLFLLSKETRDKSTETRKQALSRRAGGRGELRQTICSGRIHIGTNKENETKRKCKYNVPQLDVVFKIGRCTF